MAGDAQAWAATHAGLVRHHNEDSCQVGSWRSGRDGDSWSGRLSNAPLWAAIADGMGGHRQGAAASSLVIDCIADRVTDRMVEGDILGMLAEANARVFQAMTGPGGRPAMGSTVVGLVSTGRHGWIFNVGDSRAYVLVGGRLLLATRDHTPSRGSGARSHALTQSLGGTLTPRPLQPHLMRLDLMTADAVLLCSDGLTDMVDDEELHALLRRRMDDPAHALVQAALDGGGCDNVTAVLLRLRD